MAVTSVLLDRTSLLYLFGYPRCCGARTGPDLPRSPAFFYAHGPRLGSFTDVSFLKQQLPFSHGTHPSFRSGLRDIETQRP